ncbi:helix-turn-helix domain-containing protein [Micromonospora sp. M12]
MATTAVAVFPNTTMTINYLPGQAGVGRAIVRRAAEFIEAHAAVPLTVGRIAEACEVSQRALQVAFQRYHGQSPMAFLRAVRLRQAHWDLQHAKPGQTVAETARRWAGPTPGGSPRRTARRTAAIPMTPCGQPEYRHRWSRTADERPAGVIDSPS